MNEDWKAGFTGAIMAARAKGAEIHSRAVEAGPLTGAFLFAKEEAVKELVLDLEAILKRS